MYIKLQITNTAYLIVVDNRYKGQKFIQNGIELQITELDTDLTELNVYFRFFYYILITIFH